MRASASHAVVHTKRLWEHRLLVVDIGTNVLIPLPLAQFRVILAPGQSGGDEGLQRYSVVDGTCSPAGVLESDCLLPGGRQTGDVLWVGMAGAYTWALAESFYDVVPSAWWLTDRGSLEPIVSRHDNRLAAFAMNGLLPGEG